MKQMVRQRDVSAAEGRSGITDSKSWKILRLIVSFYKFCSNPRPLSRKKMPGPARKEENEQLPWMQEIRKIVKTWQTIGLVNTTLFLHYYRNYYSRDSEKFLWR